MDSEPADGSREGSVAGLHGQLADDEVVLRRFPRQFTDGIGPTRRVTSQAFQNSSDGSPMSGHAQGVLAQLGLPPEAVLDGTDAELGFVAITVSDLRSI